MYPIASGPRCFSMIGDNWSGPRAFDARVVLRACFISAILISGSSHKSLFFFLSRYIDRWALAEQLAVDGVYCWLNFLLHSEGPKTGLSNVIAWLLVVVILPDKPLMVVQSFFEPLPRSQSSRCSLHLSLLCWETRLLICLLSSPILGDSGSRVRRRSLSSPIFIASAGKKGRTFGILPLGMYFLLDFRRSCRSAFSHTCMLSDFGNHLILSSTYCWKPGHLL